MSKPLGMITELRIQGFRGFSDLTISPLQRVNLIGGRNNTGKSSVLEALFLYLGAGDPWTPLHLFWTRSTRTLPRDEDSVRELLWKPLFTQFDDSRPLTVGVTDSDGETASLQVRVVPSARVEASLALPAQEGTAPSKGRPSRLLQHFRHPHAGEFETEAEVGPQGLIGSPPPARPLFPSSFLPSTTRLTYEDAAEKFGKLEREGGLDLVIDGLRVIDPRIHNLFTSVQAGVPMIWARLDDQSVLPLHLLGEGAVRLGSILLLMGNARDGFLLVDEIENGLHWSVLDQVWRGIALAARENRTQVFATTHSWECIQAARRAFVETPEELTYHRLERFPEGLRSESYSTEQLRDAAEIPLEVR